MAGIKTYSVPSAAKDGTDTLEKKERPIMAETISAQALEIIRKMQQNELTESVIYEKIAAFAKGDENKQTLRRLAREEKAHYEIWKNTPARK